MKETIQKEVEVESETRPNGWVFRKNLKEGAVYLIETKPRVGDMAFRDGSGTEGFANSDDTNLVKVSYPRLLWMLTIVRSHVVSVSVYWIQEPFKAKKMDTPLFRSPLPNVDNNGFMCTGDIEIPTSKDDATVVNECMEYIFSSIWGTDSNMYRDVLSAVGLKGIRGWSRATLRNDKLRVEIPPKLLIKRTLKEEIKAAAGDFETE